MRRLHPGLLFATAALCCAASARAASLDSVADRLRHPSWNERERAVRELSDWGETALPLVFQLLKDPDPEVRRQAAAILERAEHLPGLLRMAFQSGAEGAAWVFRRWVRPPPLNAPPGPTRLQLALGAAGHHGGRECVPYVCEVVARGAREGVVALIMLDEPDLAARLLRGFATPDNAPSVLPALGEIGGAGTVPFLERQARHASETVRRFARVGLLNRARAARYNRMASVLLGPSSLARETVRRELARAEDIPKTRVATALVLRGGRGDTARALKALCGDWVCRGVSPALLEGKRASALVALASEAIAEDMPERTAAWWVAGMAGRPGDRDAVALLANAWKRKELRTAVAEAYSRWGDHVAPLLGELMPEMLREFGLSGLLRLAPADPGTPFFEAIEELVLRGSPARAREAIAVLSHVRDRRAVSILAAGVGRDGIRRECLLGMSKQARLAGFIRLHELFFKTFEPRLLEGLGRTGDVRALPVLKAALPVKRLRPHALRGLGLLKDVDVLPVLEHYLYTDDGWRSALKGLENYRDPAALPVLLRFKNALRCSGREDRARAADRVIRLIYSNR